MPSTTIKFTLPACQNPQLQRFYTCRGTQIVFTYKSAVMKKSIANKIERLLSSLITGPDQSSKKITSVNDLSGMDPDNMHYEKNPDRPIRSKLPQRLLELLRPKNNNPNFSNT